MPIYRLALAAAAALFFLRSLARHVPEAREDIMQAAGLEILPLNEAG